MSNPLFKSVCIVAVFWYFVIALISGVNPFHLPWYFVQSLGIVVLGAVCGISGYIGFRLLSTEYLLERLQRGDLRRGAKLSVGMFPDYRPVDRHPLPTTFWQQYRFNFSAYQTAHPKHAALMLAAAEVMYAKPSLPASPVPGGHGGATLIGHSFNVVRQMERRSKTWRYVGQKNKKGEIVFPLMDPAIEFHAFDSADPILPLTAFIHDIGKVRCYAMQANGRIKEVVENHDTEGARLLRRLPELWALSHNDATDILLAVGYYHHSGSLPTTRWVSDRARSLTELLIAVDVETGQLESGEGDRVLDASIALEDAEAVRYVPPNMEGIASDKPRTPVPPVSDTPNLPQHSAVSAEAPLEDDPLDLFLGVLLEANRVNGRNSSQRIGFKHGDWLYIADAKLRAAIAKRTGESAFEEVKRGVMHPWTLTLLERLHGMGALMVEHNGLTFSYKRAIFNTSTGEGDLKRVERFVIIVSTRPFAALAKIPDCKSPPIIDGCSWGATAAINKRSSDTEDGPPLDVVAGEPAKAVASPETEASESFELKNSQSESELAEMANIVIVHPVDTEVPFYGEMHIEAPEVPNNAPEDSGDFPFDLTTNGTASDGKQSFNLEGVLRRVAMFEEDGPAFIEKKVDGVRCALFEMATVVEYYEIDEKDINVKIVTGGASGKDFFAVTL
jgi:hypothetical protein